MVQSIWIILSSFSCPDGVCGAECDTAQRSVSVNCTEKFTIVQLVLASKNCSRKAAQERRAIAIKQQWFLAKRLSVIAFANVNPGWEGEKAGMLLKSLSHL